MPGCLYHLGSDVLYWGTMQQRHSVSAPLLFRRLDGGLAAEGGAQLARYAWWREQNGGRGTFEELRANDGEDGERFKLVAEPKGDNFEAYAGLIGKYRECEEEVVKLCANLV